MEGATFDVVVAKQIDATRLEVRGPIWGAGLHFAWAVMARPDGKEVLRLGAFAVPPPLGIRKTGGGVELLYPTNYVGFMLQGASTLNAASWSDVSSGANLISLSRLNPVQFYRLLKR